MTAPVSGLDRRQASELRHHFGRLLVGSNVGDVGFSCSVVDDLDAAAARLRATFPPLDDHGQARLGWTSELRAGNALATGQIERALDAKARRR